MKIGQVRWNGRLTAAIFENGQARPAPETTLLDIVLRSERDKTDLPTYLRTHASRHPEDLLPAIPISPREVWACGCTYEMSASFRDAEHVTREGFYRHV